MLRVSISNQFDAALRAIAHRGFTALFFLLTAAGSLLVSEGDQSATLMMVVPFSLLTLNLVAAIVTLPRFRRDFPLLLFHLCLLLLALLLVFSRLTYMHSTTGLGLGETFDGTLIDDERGPLASLSYRDLRFTNLGFVERIEPGSPYSVTYNHVRWLDDHGEWHDALVDSERPLRIHGYRLYTSSFRGYVANFRWTDPTNISMGSVQLNSTNMGELAPAGDWTLPDGTPIWVMLETDDHAPDITGELVNMGIDQRQPDLVVRVGEERHPLKLGQSINTHNGSLTYTGVEAWMGYRILRDPSLPWINATVIIGVLSLSLFYLRQLSGRSWDADR